MKYTAEEVIAASQVEIGDNLLLTSREQVANSLHGQLPYIDGVTVQQILPDILQITVTERTAIGIVPGNLGWWLINREGKLLEQVLDVTSYEGNLEIVGVTVDNPVPGETLRLSDSLKESSLLTLMSTLDARGMLEQVSQIDLSQATELTFLYQGRIRVILPLLEPQLDAKLEGLHQAMEQILPNEVGTLDLTRDVGERWYFKPD